MPQSQPRSLARIQEELVENGEYCWRARATDGPGFSGFSDVACFVFSLIPEAPSAPVAQAPVDEVGTRTPAFVWRNSTDPEGQELTYSLEVRSQDNALVFSAGNIAQSDGETTTFDQIPDDRLADNQTYTWTVFAVDEDTLRSEGSSLTFFIDLEARAPVAQPFIFPDPDFVLEDASDFVAVAAEAVDEEGDEVSYAFFVREADADEDLFSVQGLSAEGGVVVFEADLSGAGLEEDARYRVVQIASDNDGDSAPVELTFVFSATNESPGAVTLQSPADGELVETVQPTFVWRNTTDPEGDAFTYDLVVSLSDFPDEAIFEVTGVEPGDGAETSLVGGVLPEDLGLVWKVRAVDERGAVGDFSDPGQFVVNTVNQRPSSPVLLEPSAGLILEDGQSVSFSWQDSVDPEGDEIVYLFEVFSADGLPVSVALEVEPSADESGVTTFTFPAALEVGGYSWRVRAQAGGAFSQFSNSEAFAVALAEVDPPRLPETCQDFEELGLDAPAYCDGELGEALFPDPKGGCACAQTPAAPVELPALLLFLSVMGLAVLRARRRD